MPKKIIRLREPLLMETGTKEEPGLRVLPIGTILYQTDESNIYVAWFDHSGWLDFDGMGKGGHENTAPVRLRRMTSEELIRRSLEFPLTKDDLAAVIKAEGIDRNELADILKGMSS